jgi:RNA polymerase sigma factor (sigma-70 family)
VTDVLSFRDLMRRVRARDQEAAAELVRLYEPEIHRAVRTPLMYYRLHRVLDSRDISQVVLANFFSRATNGSFELDQPEQLVKLLTTMARNQVRDEARKHQAGRRDFRRLEQAAGEQLMDVLTDTEPTPSTVVAGHELVEEMYRRLSSDERRLAEHRARGKDWATIAAEEGASAEALRKKLARAIDRVTIELGLGEVSCA